MSLPYIPIDNYTGSINSNTYLNEADIFLLSVSQSSDVWFGISTNDVIEVSAYSTDDQTILNWGIVGNDKQFQTTTLTFLNSLDNVSQYSYTELIAPFTIYKNKSILLKPSEDLANIGITGGSYVVSYNFTREMAGTMFEPLIIKDISNTRTEIKLIPKGQADSRYDSFCIKRFSIKDVAPILLSISKDLPYDKIYAQMSSLSQYKNGITFLKFMFFLSNDGAVVSFLKNLYEDFIKYTFLAPTQTTGGTDSATITRTQGIRTYYNNFLLQSYEFSANFDEIKQKFINFVNLRLDQRFGQFSNLAEEGYKDARQFCYDFFVVYFYNNAVDPLQTGYEDKYFGYLKNALNFGSNSYSLVLDHGFLDERESPTDPLTLILKLQNSLPTDISKKDTCWVSNFGMVPYTFTAIIQNPVKYITIKISPPNFSSPQIFINKEQTNTLYSSDDLNSDSTTTDDININKQIAELNTDFSDFSNFIVFSSAQNRLNIFKNKMVQWTFASSSLSELERRYILSLSSSIPYPYYSVEKSSFQSQTTELINSFDSYESYLFSGGKYTYIVSSGSFLSSSYVADQDILAQSYDKYNRDSLIANVPQYLTDDPNSSEYLTFLNMIGHHFDNIYTYLSALPIERHTRNELTSSIPIKTLKEMLYSFGWSVDDIIGSLDIDEVYLNSMNSASYDVLSGQQRLQIIWNRILVNLPGIYKTKGTEQCVNYLMACYGLPSSMITIREYGGTDFADDPSPTYQLDEKTYMLQFSSVNDYIEGPIPNSTRTVEFKFSVNTIDSKSYYQDFRYVPLFSSIPYPYSTSANFNWTLGFYKVPGLYTGKMIFQMGSGSSGIAITSSVLPILNGDIFSVMLRRNLPFEMFESSLDPSVIPLQYDLYVQRNDDGRRLFYSTSSVILYDDDNDVFAQFGRFKLTNGLFKGTVDKLSIWDIPIDDNDFEEHVNDLNSYGYSGSAAYQNLWVRLNWDYPQNMYSELTSSVWIDNKSPYYYIQNYYTDETLTTVNADIFSASMQVVQSRWLTYYPTGSVEIRGYNFPEAIGSAFSASWQNYQPCHWHSQSVYPYHFEELTYQQNMDASKYGPNKYKNKKIRKINYEVSTRFDPFNRSTNESDQTVSGESNQLGFFIDPQDSKNKDVLRYVGRNGIMELIGDPSNLYSDKYYDLINENVEYNYEGDKKTHFNELLTIYKFYFDKSIFKAIKNVMPARANIYTGVVIEPTLLERPKYQNRPVSSSVQVSYEEPTVINQIYTFDEQLVWADFNTDWSLVDSGSGLPGFPTTQEILNYYLSPFNGNVSNINRLPIEQQTPLQRSMVNSSPSSYQDIINLNYLTYPNRDWPDNLSCGPYVDDYMDKIQHDFYPDFEKLPRLWESTLPSYNVPILGSVTAPGGPNNLIDALVVGPDHGVFDPTTYFSGSNNGNHQTIYYMLKVWDNYHYYAKSGDYIRSINPLDNTYDSASVYLYKYIIVDERVMRTLIYFTDLVSGSLFGATDISYNWVGTPSVGVYRHKANTFINTPDQNFSNIKATPNIITPINRIVFDLYLSPTQQYFELASGYPRNHYTHKLQQMSKWKYGDYFGKIFVKGRQTTDSTINSDGINDGSLPVWSSNTSNVNVIKTGNILKTVSTINDGQIVSSGITTTAGTTTIPTKPINNIQSQTSINNIQSQTPIFSTNVSNIDTSPIVKVKIVTAGAGALGSVGNNMYIVNDRGQSIQKNPIKLTTSQYTALKIGNIVTINGVRYKQRI